MTRKKTIYIVIPAIVIIAGIIAFMPLGDDGNSIISSAFDDDRPECAGGPYFTHLPIDEQYINSIIPLGNLNPSGHTFPTDHVYFNFSESAQDIPVYAPGDATVTTISSAYNTWADPPFTDYSVNFMVCDGIEAYYIHVNTLSQKLLSAFEENLADDGCETYETGGRQFTNCWADVNVPITAGKEIATTAREGQHNFDLGLYDMTQTAHVFANPNRFDKYRQYQYTRCPFDYFAADMQHTLAQWYGGWEESNFSKRTIEPVCGSIAQDVPGTAQGLWFIEGTPEPVERGEDAHMALVHDNVDPSLAVFSIGNSLEELGIPSATYEFTPQENGLINRDFDSVTADGNVYCYEAYGGSATHFENRGILLTMPDVNTLHIGPHAENECGDEPYTLDGYSVFER